MEDNTSALTKQAESLATICTTFFKKALEVSGDPGVALSITFKWMDLNLVRQSEIDPKLLDKAVKKFLGIV